jgi:hypothetical protein
LTEKPPCATTDVNMPLWPACSLLEWYLMRLDDKSYKQLYKSSTVPGRDIPLSGDPVLDEEILRYYEELDRGNKKQQV